jgi:hypothetical protein
MENMITIKKEKSNENESSLKEILEKSDLLHGNYDKIYPVDIQEEIKNLNKILNDPDAVYFHRANAQQKYNEIVERFKPDRDKLRFEILLLEKEIISSNENNDELINMMLDGFFNEDETVEEKTNKLINIFEKLTDIEKHFFVISFANAAEKVDPIKLRDLMAKVIKHEHLNDTFGISEMFCGILAIKFKN